MFMPCMKFEEIEVCSSCLATPGHPSPKNLCAVHYAAPLFPLLQEINKCFDEAVQLHFYPMTPG
jgi:hypothetical protein